MPQSKTLTLLLDGKTVFAYEGLWTEAVFKNAIVSTGYGWQNGMGAFIRQKQNKLAQKKELIVLIKPLSSASYQNFLTALDETKVNGVQQYAVVDASDEEKAFLQKQ